MPSSHMNKEREQPNSPEEQPDCKTISEAEIDAALEGSFPASDPIPWTLGTPSCPDPEGETERSDDSENE